VLHRHVSLFSLNLKLKDFLQSDFNSVVPHTTVESFIAAYVYVDLVQPNIIKYLENATVITTNTSTIR
jgi:hypothetical protein